MIVVIISIVTILTVIAIVALVAIVLIIVVRLYDLRLGRVSVVAEVWIRMTTRTLSRVVKDGTVRSRYFHDYYDSRTPMIRQSTDIASHEIARMTTTSSGWICTDECGAGRYGIGDHDVGAELGPLFRTVTT